MGKKIRNRRFNILVNKITFILIIVTFLSVSSSSFAYYSYKKDDQDTISGKIATVNLELHVTKILPIKKSTGVMVPQKSISGSSTSALSSALKRGCVDDNENIVCQVYDISIVNNGGSATEIVNGTISFFSNSEMTANAEIKMPNLSWKLITSVDTTNNSNSVLGTNIDNKGTGEPKQFVKNVALQPNIEKKYYMIIWFNETGTDQIDKSNTYYGKVEFTSSNGTESDASFG